MTEEATLEKTEQSIDKSAVRDFAVNARRKLKEKVELQANKMGFFADGRKVEYEFVTGGQFKVNNEFFYEEQADILRREIKQKGFDTVIDEVAYTWFNRFIALYYMEKHNYIDNGLSIISSIDNINSIALKAPNFLKSLDKESLFQAVQDSNTELVYKKLVIAQCNELNNEYPFLFEKISDYTELLFPAGMSNNDSVIREMLALDEHTWDEVEIIGWLYQYYIAEYKQFISNELKNGGKVLKENIPAVTQIFTPKWIVKYMVENSVGKLWLEAHPNSELQGKFKYYLESAEQEEDVKQKLNEIINKNISPEEIKVLDPACGSGHILVTAFEVLYEIYKSAGYMEDDIAKLILTKNLYGLDICDRAAQLSQLAVIMKAREFDKNISNKVTELNITSIQESNWINDSRVKECLMSGVENNLLAQSQIQLMIDTFKDAKEYGSIINAKDFDLVFWNERLNAIQSLNMGLLYLDVVQELQDKLPKLVKQAKIMQQKYEVVISNPPYMGERSINPTLSNFIKNNYKTSKGDLYSVFMEKSLNTVAINGYVSMVTIQSWMFLSTYKFLRELIIDNYCLSSMVHLGPGAFEELTFNVLATSFVIKNTLIKNYIPTIKRLVDYYNALEKNIKYFENNNIYRTFKVSDFKLIPNSLLVYWLSKKQKDILQSEKSLSNFATTKVGLQTGNNSKFVRNWQEVNIKNIGFNCSTREEAKISNKKWFPYNKSGNFRKYYGNNECVVNWENDGFEIINLRDSKGKQLSRPQNTNYYFKKGVTYCLFGFDYIGVRYNPEGAIFDVGSSSIFCKDSFINYLLGFLVSKVSFLFLSAMNPTVNFQVGDIANLPFIITDNKLYIDKINELVKENISISVDDWDSYETSWNFEQHPLLRFKENGKVQESFNKWKEYKLKQYNTLKTNEEELNKIFIDIYGLNNEITPVVTDRGITVRIADEEDDIKSLMSYAVGCMLGRYSLDEKGLAFAGGEFNSSKYKTLEVDEDGILPILSDTWFEDDIVEEFKRFLRKAFGELYFNENMQYIADILGRKGSESAEDRIRTYYLKDFYKDHVQTYKKRPIYWMFTSGKEKAFNCLMYLHRYDKTTLSRIRKDYLHEFQAKLDRAVSQAEDEGNVKWTSLYAKYQKELLDFDAKIKDLADEQIELDLDDGVQVNYAKFKGLMESEKDIIKKEK